MRSGPQATFNAAFTAEHRAPRDAGRVRTNLSGGCRYPAELDFS
jgi:hypothetical protein